MSEYYIKKINKESSSIYFAYSAALRVHGDIDDIDSVTDFLGIIPTYKHLKGQVRNKKNGINLWDKSMWMYEVPVPEEYSLDVHIQKLWEIIKPNKDKIKRLKESYTVDIFCGYRSNSTSAGFEISPFSLEMFIELGIPLEVSIIII